MNLKHKFIYCILIFSILNPEVYGILGPINKVVDLAKKVHEVITPPFPLLFVPPLVPLYYGKYII